MNQNEITTRGALNDLQLTQLVDQLDPAIGEATSVMGALTSEIIRRALRGGVMELGRELNGYVGGLVENQIIQQRPAIDKAATETATEVARAEVGTVRQAITEQGQQLAAQIEDASRQVQQVAQEQDQQLAAKIDDTARQAQAQADAVARELSGRLEETVRQTDQKVEAVAGDLSGRLETTARTLETEVAASDARTLETARTEFTEQLEAVRAKSRQTAGKINERLDKLDATSAELADLQRAHKETWQLERENLLQQIEAMTARLDELEKPRGLRAVFAWLFGKKKKKTSPPKRESSKDGEAAFSDDKAEV